MPSPDPGPLLDEHLDELELICRASENDGHFDPTACQQLGIVDSLLVVDYVLGWHDRHDRQLLEAARWALANGWTRGGSDGAATAP